MTVDLSDSQLMDMLHDVDEDDDVDVTSWEAEFIDSIFKQYDKYGRLTEKQRAKVLEIVEEYE